MEKKFNIYMRILSFIQMFTKQFENLLSKEIKDFTKKYNEENDNVIPDEYLNGLLEMFEFGKKTKQNTNKKELSDDERCIALKLDKTRCNARKSKDSEICNLHLRSGAKHGTINEIVEDEDEEENQKKEEKVKNQKQKSTNTCIYLLKKGSKKDSMCGKNATNSMFCSKHSNTKVKSVKLEDDDYPVKDEIVEEIVSEDEYPIDETINISYIDENKELFGSDCDSD